jgi:tetratricopeptide (TPR) repeat protein
MKNSAFRNFVRFILVCALAVLLSGICFYKLFSNSASASNETETAIESALYTRAEFFGSNALVPFPTAIARKNLAEVAEKFPDNAEITLKLAQLDEKLSDFKTAEDGFLQYVKLSNNDVKSLEQLALFYQQRGQFEQQAKTLEQILNASPTEKKTEVFARLIESAKVHDLEKYQKAEFYQQVVNQNADIFPIIEKFIDKLIEEKNYSQALQILRLAKSQFPLEESYLLKKEVSVLLEQNKTEEAEAIYHQSFNPLWTEDEAYNYYDFLQTQDRFRAYGTELKTKFRQNPADFDTALRLIHFQQHDYISGNDASAPLILKVEKSRAEKNITWEPEEMVFAARFLLADNEGDLASRFLYTLFARDELKNDKQLRAKVLYQLFEIFSDAEKNRLALTKGDLKFYQDIAASDTHPGISNGLLSLLLSETNPNQRFAETEREAAKLFNRQAAYRIFQTYKQENETSPELAQMYLDNIRLFTAAKDSEIAEKTLNEFAERFENTKDFPLVALKLADSYNTVKNYDKEREIYQKILDYLGQRRDKQPLYSRFTNSETSSEISNTESEKITPPNSENLSQFNEGINIPQTNTTADYYDQDEISYRDNLKNSGVTISYDEILSRYIASLTQDKQNDKILSLFTAELNKYPQEQWLYLQLLQWLEQTNLVDEQLKIYQTAIDKFPTRSWQDCLARWFIRQKRQNEFADYSRNLLEKLSDSDTEDYLYQFANVQIGTKPEDFDARLYFQLYSQAHRRFPHNLYFVKGLLNYYKNYNQPGEWRKLTAEYYFESTEIRQIFLRDLAEKNQLRDYLAQAKGKCCEAVNDLTYLPYTLFAADASALLSYFEEAIPVYRQLNEMYPNTAEFQERLISLTRSFGQTKREFSQEAGTLAFQQAEQNQNVAAYRTRSGEILAELGNYEKANSEWQKIIETAKGEPDSFLETATVQWDYFQFEQALQTIRQLRQKLNDSNIYAFETAAILEAQEKKKEAIVEYVKGLADINNYQSKKRLKQLYPKFSREIQTAFDSQNRKTSDNSALILGYADLLYSIKQRDQAAAILELKVSQSQNTTFIEKAQNLFSDFEDSAGEIAALKRLTQTAGNQRKRISYTLELANALNDDNQRENAKNVFSKLVADYPTNYGVLVETADFYWKNDYQEDSINVLRKGFELSKGEYRHKFARFLSDELISLNRPAEAEPFLVKLHNENPTDTDVFQELARVYVRLGKPDKMRESFAQTVAAIKAQDDEKEWIDTQIAELRESMIEAFTRLRDYRSAMEQHIEIINRQPDEEEKVENAIRYAKRYGGAEFLREYYEKTSAEAFKNYRWNVVLAQIYETEGDLDKAVKSYETAINNQPEMVELYQALMELEKRRKNFPAVLDKINQIIELDGEKPDHIKQKVDVLKQLGRTEEAKLEQAKLPVEEKPIQSAADKFAEASRLKSTETAKAIEIFRQGFAELLDNPTQTDIKAKYLTDYVRTIRSEESLKDIADRFWLLRRNLIGGIEQKGSVIAGKARANLQILDAAFVDAIGQTASQNGTTDECSALFADWENRLKEISVSDDRYNSLSLLQNLANRAGFGNLEEKILVKRKDTSFTNGNTDEYHADLQKLLDFYRGHGDFAAVLSTLETERQHDKDFSKNFDYARQIADAAKLVNSTETELSALREIYNRPSTDKFIAQPDQYVARYLEILRQTRRDELNELTQKSTPFQLQLINFLISKGETALARQAIQNADLSMVWKNSATAEMSLAIQDFNQSNECYFLSALQFAPIGGLVAIKPDKSIQLVGNDWFKLSAKYGQWLYQNNPKDAENFLIAQIENRPQGDEEQTKLGQFYLKKKDVNKALEHFLIVDEIYARNPNAFADLGKAYYLSGNFQKAKENWDKILADETDENILLYLQTLKSVGLVEPARKTLLPILVKNWKIFPLGKDDYLIEQIAASFGDTPDEQRSKALYFQALCKQIKDDLLTEKIIEKQLVQENYFPEFYQILIQGKEFDEYDYNSDFGAVLKRTFSLEEAEEMLDHENNFEVKESNSERLKWQKQLLEIYLKHNQIPEASKVILKIEQGLNRRRPHPDWLRLAKIQIAVSEGKISINELKRFIGIETKFDLPKISAPSLKRFNDVLAILPEETQKIELSQAFFARNLALEQYETAHFIGLARVFFQKGDTENALKILQIGVDITDSENAESAMFALESLPFVKNLQVEPTKIENIETQNTLNQVEFLELTSELSGEFRQFEKAIEWRKLLVEMSPENCTNQIELARLLAEVNQINESIKVLANVINNRNLTRNARWQAVWLAGETIGNTQDLWQLLKETVNPDNEITPAIEILSKQENSGEVLQLIENHKSEKSSSHFQFFLGLMAKKLQKNDLAFSLFLSSLNLEKDADFAQSFAFAEDAPVFQLIRYYSANEQNYAALNLANIIKELPESKLRNNNINPSRYLTLMQKAETRQRNSTIELFGLLSKAAEKVGEFDLAIQWEEKLKNSISDESQRKISSERIEFLRQKAKEASPKTTFAISEKLVSD